MQVVVVVLEEWSVIIMIVGLVTVPVESTVGLPVPIEMQCANMPMVTPHRGITTLVPLEEVVIKPHCSPGSPGVKFVKGSSEGKVALGARGGVLTQYITNTLQGNGQRT